MFEEVEWGGAFSSDLLRGICRQIPPTEGKASKKKASSKHRRKRDNPRVVDLSQLDDGENGKRTDGQKRKRKKHRQEDGHDDDEEIDQKERHSSEDHVGSEKRHHPVALPQHDDEKGADSLKLHGRKKKRRKDRSGRPQSASMEDGKEKKENDFSEETLLQSDSTKHKTVDHKKKVSVDAYGQKANRKRAKLQQGISQAGQETVGNKKKSAPLSPSTKAADLQAKMRDKLDSARFRFVNEQLYTTTGSDAQRLFEGDEQLFQVYHRGFARQVAKWPVNPLDCLIAWLKQKPSSLLVADLGCGEAKLGASVPQAVHSFDLVAANDQVIACDMANLPLEKHSVDIVIFCLSLMGTNIGDFIAESRRIMRKRGILKIAEVKSRIEDLGVFVEAVASFGFRLVDQDDSNKMFVIMEFVKCAATSAQQNIVLKPCIYKRR